MSELDGYVTIACVQPSNEGCVPREGELQIGPLNDGSGHVHVMASAYGEVIGVVLDEAGARAAAAALLAPYEKSARPAAGTEGGAGGAADQDMAQHLLGFARIFSTGCSMAGPAAVFNTTSSPAECPECSSAFVRAVQKALTEPAPPRSLTCHRTLPTVAAERLACAAIADAEPELPGDPPASILAAMKLDPVGYARAAVQATKRNIALAIRTRA